MGGGMVPKKRDAPGLCFPCVLCLLTMSPPHSFLPDSDPDPTLTLTRLCQVLGNEDLTCQEGLGGALQALPAALSCQAGCFLLLVLAVIN